MPAEGPGGARQSREDPREIPEDSGRRDGRLWEEPRAPSHPRRDPEGLQKDLRRRSQGEDDERARRQGHRVGAVARGGGGALDGRGGLACKDKEAASRAGGGRRP